MPPVMCASVPLWTALMLISLAGASADISRQSYLSEAMKKSVVSLYPPWIRIFKGENVTFTCHTNNTLQPGSTSWFFNTTRLKVTNASLDVVNANDLNSGEYRCQNENFRQSKPVYLHVVSDWLLLQATAEKVMEGDPLYIRCHSWKNREVKKVIFYKDGKALKYWYENHNISINSTTTENSGTYYCTGRIWQHQYNSSSIKITVIKVSFIHHLYYWLKLLIPLLVVILFAVDTVLFTLTRQEFKFLLMIKSNRKGNRSMNPRRKSDPKTDTTL